MFLGTETAALHTHGFLRQFKNRRLIKILIMIGYGCDPNLSPFCDEVIPDTCRQSLIVGSVVYCENRALPLKINVI